MRNLKKILALVLALVMSLSLMATAGAASFPDVADDNAYKTAIEVLNGVEVLQGYDNGARFEPKGAITRAEAAAVIYRIATGDVNDTQKDIYTAWNGAGKLSDVSGWYAGYVNYCCNAGYIKGYPNGTFQAQNNVTGYEVLAMVLRAMGYGRNGEFSGSQWAITVGSLAQTLGITKNITETLGEPATREMVAEIVFRAIFCETQMYNALHLYEGTGTNLAANLNLEEVEGVVIANEYADLYDDDTLADGKTMVREGDKTYTINYGTTLDDLGESRMIYIQNKNTVISLADSGKNVKEETTAKESLKTVLDRAGISQSDAETYLNFGQGTNWHSDWRIRYEITIKGVSGDYANDVVERGRNAGFVLPDYPDSRYTYTAATDTLVYSEDFRINETIGAAHQNNIEEIFNIADKKNDTSYVTGEVYVGTTSMKDISDEKSFNQFLDDYIDQDDEATVNANERGNWLKVIDNNADGQADYIFKVIYTFAQVTRIRDEKVTLDVKDDNLIDEDGDPCVDIINELTGEAIVSADELVEDDVVYYAIIDGKAQTYKAAMETATIDKINRNARTATSTEGTEWTESEVCEHIKDENYGSSVGNLVGKVKYDLFFDRGGYLAAFIRSDISNNFRLILDGWYNETKTGAEYAVKYYDDETGKTSDPVDITTNGGLFISGDVDGVLNNDWNALKFFGGVDEADTGALDDLPVAALNGDTSLAANDTKTIVASISEDGTILPVHSQYVTGRNWHDMIDMIDNDIPTNKSNSTFGVVYGTTNSSDTAYDALGYEDDDITPMDHVEVIARADTVYYVVHNKTVVETATGYKNAPTGLDVEDVYVVGTYRGADNDLSNPYYYTADMVVIEVSSYENDYEAVFVLDDETSENDVSRRNLRIIGEDGKERNVYVWNGNYRLATADYGYGATVTDSRNGVKILPGVYKLYERSTDLYTLKPMTAEELRDNNFVAGYSQYVTGVAPKDFVVMRTRGLAENELGETISIWDEDSIPLAEGSLYNVWYNTDHWNNTDKTSYHRVAPTVETSTDYRDVLAGGVEEIRTTENNKNGNVNREFRGSANSTFSGVEEGWSYFYNKLLVKTNSNGDMVYAISFGNVYGGHGDEDYDLAAWTVWENNIPAAAKAAEKKDITFNLALTGMEGVRFYDADGNELNNGRIYNATDEKATISVESPGIVTIEIEGVNGANVVAVVPAADSDWVKTNGAIDGDTGRYRLTMADRTVSKLSLARLAVDSHDGTIYTQTKVTQLVTDAGSLTITDNTTLQQAIALQKELAAIQTNAVNSTVADAVGTAVDSLEEKIAAKTVVTVTSTSANVKIDDADANVIAADGPANTTITFQVKEGYTPALSGDKFNTATKKVDQTGHADGYVIYTATSKAAITENVTVTITVTATTANATFSTDDATNVKVPEDAVTCTAGNGTATIQVKNGYRPIVTTNKGEATFAKAADQDGATTGFTKYDVTLTGVYEAASVTVKALANGTNYTVTLSSGDANVTAYTTGAVTVKDDGTAEVKVTVKNGYKPVAAVTPAGAIAFTAGTPGETTTEWTGAVSGVNALATATITTAVDYVTLTNGDEAHITIANNKATVDTNATGTIVVAEGYNPVCTDETVSFAAGETKDGKTTYTVTITSPDPAKTYTITTVAGVALTPIAASADVDNEVTVPAKEGTNAQKYILLDKGTSLSGKTLTAGMTEAEAKTALGIDSPLSDVPVGNKVEYAVANAEEVLVVLEFASDKLAKAYTCTLSADIGNLAIVVGDDGVISGDEPTTEGTLSYYFVAATKATVIDAWTTSVELTTAVSDDASLGINKAAEANKPEITDKTTYDSQFLIVIESKDGKVVAAGQSGAISIGDAAALTVKVADDEKSVKDDQDQAYTAANGHTMHYYKVGETAVTTTGWCLATKLATLTGTEGALKNAVAVDNLDALTKGDNNQFILVIVTNNETGRIVAFGQTESGITLS